LFRTNDFTDTIPISIHADPNYLIIVNNISHIPIDKVRIKFTFLLVNHENFILLAGDVDLFVIVNDVEVCCFINIAKLEIESSLEARIPTIEYVLPKADQPRDAEKDVGNQKKSVTPCDKFYWRYLKYNTLSLDLNTLVPKKDTVSFILLAHMLFV
jgi:hypothetical protein